MKTITLVPCVCFIAEPLYLFSKKEPISYYSELHILLYCRPSLSFSLFFPMFHVLQPWCCIMRKACGKVEFIMQKDIPIHNIPRCMFAILPTLSPTFSDVSCSTQMVLIMQKEGTKSIIFRAACSLSCRPYI